MARLPRYSAPGVPQHVIQRGNNREAIFRVDFDYEFYRECLQEAASRHGCSVHGYVLMTNHVHLLVTPVAEGSIGRTLQSVGRRYVRRFNDRYERTGTLWEGRYKATVVDDEAYLLACLRYIELNPVRARMVAHPRDYPWSSYRANAEGIPDRLVQTHPIFRGLGVSDEERRGAYRALFSVPLEEDAVAAIRAATNKGWALGGDEFRRRLAGMAARRAAPATRGRPRKVAENGV